MNHHQSKQILQNKNFNNFFFSLDPNIVLKRTEELKNKLREELKDELGGISGANEAATPHSKTARRNTAATTDNNPRVVDTTDYFELVYECIHTRNNFLNPISLNSRSPVDPDIDLVILQALLNGKRKSNFK